MGPLQTAILVVIIAIGVTGLVAAARTVRVVQQYERGVVFRLGRMRDGTRGPGLTLIVPGVDRLA
jgi:regulator of protease activity HflC (stomatin/prohibitin superfamily)